MTVIPGKQLTPEEINHCGNNVTDALHDQRGAINRSLACHGEAIDEDSFDAMCNAFCAG